MTSTTYLDPRVMSFVMAAVVLVYILGVHILYVVFQHLCNLSGQVMHGCNAPQGGTLNLTFVGISGGRSKPP
jgi:hypothetical protein